MNAHQRQRLVNAGFTKKDIDILDIDALPVRKHDYYIDMAIALREVIPQAAKRLLEIRKTPRRQLTQAEIRSRQADQVPLTDDEVGRLVADGIRDSVRSALNTIRGRVN